MCGTEFSPLARFALSLLASFEPRWSLSGWAALWRFPNVPGPIRQLDLTWRGLGSLDSVLPRVRQTLEAAGLETFRRENDGRVGWLGLRQGEFGCALKLIAEPHPPLEPPGWATLDGFSFVVESPRDVLVSALCALFRQPDVRDLEDVRLTLLSGARLEQALADAPRQDPEFSPLHLAWNLAGIEAAGSPSGGDVDELKSFRARLVNHIMTCCWPESLIS